MSHHCCSYRILIAAEADSSFLARVTGTLASLSLIPESFCSRREAADANQTTLAIVLIGATARQVDLLERKVLQMTQVLGVKCENTDVDFA